MDNNLTDIEEDFNENDSVRKQLSMQSYRADGAGMTVQRRLSGLSQISKSKGSVNGEPIPSHLLVDEERKSHFANQMPPKFASVSQPRSQNMLHNIKELEHEQSSRELAQQQEHNSSFKSNSGSQQQKAQLNDSILLRSSFNQE